MDTANSRIQLHPETLKYFREIFDKLINCYTPIYTFKVTELKNILVNTCSTLFIVSVRNDTDVGVPNIKFCRFPVCYFYCLLYLFHSKLQILAETRYPLGKTDTIRRQS